MLSASYFDLLAHWSVHLENPDHIIVIVSVVCLRHVFPWRECLLELSHIRQQKG